jgi:hypothetical protein
MAPFRRFTRERLRVADEIRCSAAGSSIVTLALRSSSIAPTRHIEEAFDEVFEKDFPAGCDEGIASRPLHQSIGAHKAS